jgi:hypothetical protein
MSNWNNSDAKPDHACLCEVKNAVRNKVTNLGDSFQYWNGEFWGFACRDKDQAIQYKDIKETFYLVIQWREVQS